jgi:hypothetical protein
MKRTLFAVVAASLLFVAPGFSFAQDQEGQSPPLSFEQRKAQFLARIDGRIAQLQAEKACVSSAITPEAMRACMPRQFGRMQGHQKTGQ